MELFFRKYGSGPDLVILHGLFGSSDNWTTIAKALSGNFTVYLPDLRNHGNSPHSDLHGYEAMSSDIRQFASDNNLKKFFLAGHSMGGKVAVRFALEWPEMLNGLAVADISPFETGKKNPSGYTQHIEILRTAIGTDISGAGSRADLEKIFGEKIKSPSIRGFILKNIKRNTNGTFTWKINCRALLNNIDMITAPVALPDGSSTRVTGFPVLFLKGEHSIYLPERDYEGILSVFPAAQFRTIRNAGHWLHSDNPEEVISALTDLIKM
jgi:pimeloyl-ACP methyl ester carboxylesterase